MLKRTARLIAAFLITCLLVNCKKDPNLVTFDQKIGTDFTYPASTLLDLPQILTPGISTNWQADFTNHNTDKDHLKETKLKSLVMKITNPPGKTFDFLQSIEIYIQADGLQETKIAYADNIPDNIGQTLSLSVVDVDLTPYAKKDSFKLRINSKLKKYNSTDTDIHADMVFGITAQVIQPNS